MALMLVFNCAPAVVTAVMKSEAVDRGFKSRNVPMVPVNCPCGLIPTGFVRAKGTSGRSITLTFTVPIC